MPVEVKIPQLGESITEAEIVRWLKADGDEVAEDEPLAEIETDKATAELPAPASGVLEILVEEGATVKPGQLVARIAEGKGSTERKAKTAWARAQPDAERKVARESEAPPPPAESARPARPSPSVPAEADDGVATDRARDEQDAGEKSRPSSGTGPRPAGGENAGAVLSPAARRIAEENDVDPERVRASGRGGRVTKQDVLSYLEGGDAERDGTRERGAHDARRQPPAEPDEAAAGDAETGTDDEAERGTAQRDEAARARDDEGAGGDREERRLSLVRTPAADAPARGPATTDGEGEADGERRVRMSRLRRSIAQRLVDAQQTAAILTTFNEIDMTRVMEVRGRFKDKFAQTHGVSLGFMSFFARACILSIRDIPEINARIEGDEVVYSSRVHLGIAASTDRGLVVPVVRDADTLTLADLEREIGRLAELARSGRIGLDDLTGGTFTISNGGVFGSLLSTPILNPPQSAILGMHKIEKRPVVVGDQIVARSMMYVALSYDHRLIDGREAVTYLVRVKERIEDPERLLLEI